MTPDTNAIHDRVLNQWLKDKAKELDEEGVVTVGERLTRLKPSKATSNAILNAIQEATKLAQEDYKKFKYVRTDAAQAFAQMEYEKGTRETAEAHKKCLYHAWEILENNRIHLVSRNPKFSSSVTDRDIDQRKDELGLIYSCMFDCSFNDAIKYLASHSPQYEPNKEGDLSPSAKMIERRPVDTHTSTTKAHARTCVDTRKDLCNKHGIGRQLTDEGYCMDCGDYPNKKKGCGKVIFSDDMFGLLDIKCCPKTGLCNKCRERGV